MAYPIPEKPYDEADFDYFLVALPRGIGFHRAAFGHFSDLGSSRFWGMEGYVKPDSDDAAQRMLQAIAKTMEIYEMGWLENMYAAVDDIEALLTALRDLSCCGAPSADMFYPDGVTIAPTDELVDQTGGDIVRDVGSPPGGIGTWATYDVDLCSEVTGFIDETLPAILNICEQFFDVVQTLAYPVVIAAAAAVLAAMGIAVPAVFLSITQLGTAIELIRQLLQNEDTVFDTYASEIAAARQDLICAIFLADTPEEAEADFRAALQTASPKGYDWIRSTAPLGYLFRRMFNADTDTNNSGGFGGPAGDCGTCATPPIPDNVVGVYFGISGTGGRDGARLQTGAWNEVGRLNETGQTDTSILDVTSGSGLFYRDTGDPEEARAATVKLSWVRNDAGSNDWDLLHLEACCVNDATGTVRDFGPWEVYAQGAWHPARIELNESDPTGKWTVTDEDTLHFDGGAGLGGTSAITIRLI